MAKKSRGMSWDQASPSVGGNRRYTDDIDVYAFNEDWTRLRLVGNVWEIRQHWLPTIKKTGGETTFPKLCLSTGDPNAKCPYCQAGLRRQVSYLSNAIIRDIQENKPENKKKLGVVPKDREFREKGDEWWSPIKVVQFPSSVADKIKGYRTLNKTKDGKMYDVNHPKFGRDLLISKNPANSGAGMYDIQREDRIPLTEEELEYLLFDIDKVFDFVESYQEALETLRGVYNKGLLTDDNSNFRALTHLMDSFGDEDSDDPRKSKKSSKNTKRQKDYEDDDEPDNDDLDDDDIAEEPDDDDLDDDDEPDDEPESKKNKGKSKSKKRSESEDDDDLDDDPDDDDLDDDDDEPAPKPKGKSKDKGKGKKRSEPDDDDDLDDDESDDDPDDDDLDDDDEPAPKSKSKGKSKKQPEPEDDDDLDDDDLDDDLDDKPKSKSKEKPRKGKK